MLIIRPTMSTLVAPSKLLLSLSFRHWFSAQLLLFLAYTNYSFPSDQLLRWYDEDIGLFLYPNGAYYFWQAGVMITAVASLAALDSGVKSRTAGMWQNTYLKGGQPSHGVIQLDSAGRKIVVPKGTAQSVPGKFRKREQGFLASH